MNDQATATISAVNSGTMIDENENKFLTFRLGKEEYGLEILRVREIIGVTDITPLPQTPEFVKGVINLRGKIIPVIELRSKFGLISVDYTEATCIIVVEVMDSESVEPFSMGVIVDAVSEVMDIGSDQIEPAPNFGCSLPAQFIMGMGKIKEKVIILLDIEKVMSESDVKNLMNVTDHVDPTAQLDTESNQPTSA